MEFGKVKVQIETSNNPLATLDNWDVQFNDGRWHDVVLTVLRDLLILTIDNQPMRTSRLIRMQTGLYYYLAGGILNTPGFVGCMRKISIDGNYKLPTDWKEEVRHCILMTFCQKFQPFSCIYLTFSFLFQNLFRNTVVKMKLSLMRVK